MSGWVSFLLASPGAQILLRRREEDVVDFLNALTKALQENPHVIDAIKSSRAN